MIKDMVNEMTGDRVGLTLFAGEVRRHVPMTNHYRDFKQALDEVGPDNLNRGGSRLGDAIVVASGGFLEQSSQHKTLVLLTDGEDQESEPIEAARAAHQDQGVRIFAIGLGDAKTGSRIPLPSGSLPSARSRQTKDGPSEFVTHQGEQVWSKLDGRTLTEIAKETGGTYIPAGTRQVNMASVYHRYIANVETTTFETARIHRLESRFQWFLLPAVLLLITESLWDFRRASQ